MPSGPRSIRTCASCDGGASIHRRVQRSKREIRRSAAMRAPAGKAH
ncbi:hypothetical protein C9413_20545 [Rhizobium sp. SEMIA 4085]|nr:hypothetical protein [Rhizobium sp. SEMIA 4085]